MKSFTALAALTGIFSEGVNAFWRMECNARVGLARIDPLVQPNEAANHAHVIHGGNNFGMASTYDDLRASECTSCRVTQDKSAYWTPSMHFIHANGTTEIVQQVGGMLAYYLLYGDNIKAFPAGFQMLAGDARLRNFSGPVPDKEKSLWGPEDKTQFALGQKALGFNCLNYAKTPEASMYRHFLPSKEYMDANCANGIRAEIFFPSCWNGKDKDSKDHKSHVQYPDLVNGGVCPEGFETRVPSLFYETIWNTAAFKGVDGQFVFSNGDPTGSGYHGDFMMGWEEQFLQQAVDTCTNPSGEITDCPLFDIISEDETAKCKMGQMPSVLKADNCVGPCDGLCGNVPVQAGPGYASAIKGGSQGSATLVYTPTQAPPSVPTLSYKAPTSAVTDKYGGGISVAAINGAETKKVNDGYIAATPVAHRITSAPVPAPPAPTPPPVQEQPQDGIISTTIYTSAGTVYDVAIKEVLQYVTVEAPAPHKHRRHMHRRDREHGLLGRH